MIKALATQANLSLLNLGILAGISDTLLPSMDRLRAVTHCFS
jgi:hypothetical protein